MDDLRPEDPPMARGARDLVADADLTGVQSPAGRVPGASLAKFGMWNGSHAGGLFRIKV
jgi:hypothetical protein